jgi:hypothetical protein
VLQVAIHGQDEFARGMIEAGGKGRGLAEVAPQFHHENPAVDCRNLFEELVGAVVGAVVDQHQLKALPYLLHDLLEAGVENRYVLFFVVKWHNNRVFCHTMFDANRMRRDFRIALIILTADSRIPQLKSQRRSSINYFYGSSSSSIACISLRA